MHVAKLRMKVRRQMNKRGESAVGYKTQNNALEIGKDSEYN